MGLPPERASAAVGIAARSAARSLLEMVGNDAEAAHRRASFKQAWKAPDDTAAGGNMDEEVLAFIHGDAAVKLQAAVRGSQARGLLQPPK